MQIRCQTPMGYKSFIYKTLSFLKTGIPQFIYDFRDCIEILEVIYGCAIGQAFARRLGSSFRTDIGIRASVAILSTGERIFVERRSRLEWGREKELRPRLVLIAAGKFREGPEGKSRFALLRDHGANRQGGLRPNLPFARLK